MPLLVAATLFASQTPITILYQPKVGTTYKHLMTMTQSAQGNDSTTKITLTTKVLAFEDGYYKVETTSETKSDSGVANPQDAKPAITYVDQHYMPKPEEKGAKGDAQKMLTNMAGAFSNGLYPSKPVSLGDKWENSIDFGKLMGAMMKAGDGDQSLKTSGKINLVFKLTKADETLFKIDSIIGGTVEMEMTAGGAEGMKIPMKFTGTGTSTADKDSGIPIDSDTKIEMEMSIGGQAVNFNMGISVKRLEIKPGN